jgi:hypothetical protein
MVVVACGGVNVKSKGLVPFAMLLLIELSMLEAEEYE